MRIARALAALLAAALALPLHAQFGWNEALPKEEYAARRARVMDRIGDGIAIVQGAAEWPSYQKFKQTVQFQYLSGVEIPRAILVIDGKARRSTLYLPARNERLERAEGPLLSPGDQAQKLTGFDVVADRTLFASQLVQVAAEARPVYAPFRSESRFAGAPESSRGWDAATLSDPWDGRLSREATFVQKVRQAIGRDVQNLDPILDSLRMVKSPAEIALIREATRQAGLAMMEAMRSAEPGVKEIEIEAVGDYIFKRNDSQAPAYFGLVACDTNAFWPHYHEGKGTLAANKLLLYDYAPDYKYYTSDVTRMMPVSGTWNADQKEMYTVYLRLYQALMSSIRPGVPVKELLKEASRKMDAWIAANPIRNPKTKAAAERFIAPYRDPQRGSFGHMVGMEVHDATVPYEVLQPGMVFTIEPALTIPEDKVYIRLEDMILVTRDGYENLSGFAPTEPGDIEKLMRELGILQLDKKKPTT